MSQVYTKEMKLLMDRFDEALREVRDSFEEMSALCAEAVAQELRLVERPGLQAEGPDFIKPAEAASKRVHP